MKHLTYGLLFAALGLGLSACSDDNPWIGSEGEGSLRLSLSTSADVIDAIPVTRASEVISAPDVKDFSILLEKNDGSYSKEWASPEAFANENGFKTGSYTITAFNGSLEDEGFEKPFFSGSSVVTVLEAHETAVAVNATLANSMVSITYTDAFKGYFTDYSASVHSEGHSYVEYAKDETRPAFIAPGDVDLTVSITDRQGRTVKVQPADFVAEARHHYHVTLDVNGGNVGEGQLVVSFDDTLVKEDVTIDLTEELFSSPAPSITLSEGYTPGQLIEILQNEAVENPLKFSVMARGGLASAKLTVSSETWTPAFGNELDLVGAAPDRQAQLADAGVKCMGFFNNPDKMALLDITEIAATMPAGRHTVTLVAKDKFMRVSDPVSVIFDTNAIAVNVSASPSIFGTNRADLVIDYNGRDVEKAFTFKAEDNFGGFTDCAIISAQQKARSRAIEMRSYDVAIALPATEREVVKVKVYYWGKEVAEVEVPVILPDYSIATDAFSDRVILKVNAAEDVIDPVVTALNVYIDGNKVPSSRIVRDKNQKVLYISGLSPETTYNLATTLTATPGGNITFVTEGTPLLPNGNLSAVSETINISGVKVGGGYSVWPGNYSHTSSIVRSEADGWASANPLTCWTGSSNKNTWFIVPSTYVENGEAIVRTVGYHHNGTDPARSGGAFNTKYYCENAPSDLNISVGEMFLGSSSFDGSFVRNEGTSFSARPKSLSFQYTYAPNGDEEGYAYISLLDAQGNVIGSGAVNLSTAGSFTDAEVKISSYKFGTKAASIKVGFKSSTSSQPGIVIPSGSALNEGQSLGNKTLSANSYHAFAKGSELKIKDIKVNY
ncbi:MAG: DUF4493 domain-containing protein [Bacteroides sp.]|nr:DUF4493 domain-containing protein [Bacteroides sp.]